MQWTTEQKQVIDHRGNHLLVSAAAGSGKTAVLVQRILEQVVKGMDIDRLLIMTFTKAAAGEMRERIRKKLEETAGGLAGTNRTPEQERIYEHLQKQMTLIHTAQITTIDGFCTQIIRSYFHLIGLDPGYKIADEEEMKLLKEDTAGEILEEAYREADPSFLHLVECMASGVSDRKLEEMILELYQKAMSSPDPEDFLTRVCRMPYSADTPEELNALPWMQENTVGVRQDLENALEEAAQAMNVLGEENFGEKSYGDLVRSEYEQIREALSALEQKDYIGCGKIVQAFKAESLARRTKPKGLNAFEKDVFKGYRDREKKIMEQLQTSMASDGERLLEELRVCREPVRVLTELTLRFIRRLGKHKREKNLLDFTDMEHFALQILFDPKEENGMSLAARELSERFEEVMIDEYQDSNEVQETIALAVSGWIREKKNIFMVGDVKQSIYRFRLARPELFMEKLASYDFPQDLTPESCGCRIDLQRNFRSRPEVLESINYIFRQIMGEDLGGVAYDARAALYPGASFPEGADPEFIRTEVLMVGTQMEEDEEEGEDGLGTVQEMEALAIAGKIQEMVGKERIVDKDTGAYRPVTYGDIVILLRTASGWAEPFSRVLTGKGIPNYTASRSGYFSAREIVLIMNYLRILDNPLQDIPLAGVLHSAVGNLTNQDLALLKANTDWPEGQMYKGICRFTGLDLEEEMLTEKEPVGSEAERELLRKKLTAFHQTYMRLRELTVYVPIHELILRVLKETGFGDYAQAMPAGEQRIANLNMLVQRAMEYEKTSFKGLFNFVRYVENLQKCEIDFGEVNLFGAGSESVQIMTIHKSKGLEFPIVFTAGMNKKFNLQDVRRSVLVHPDLGIGMDAVDPERRLSVETLPKTVLRRRLTREMLGEELRILYVAMTRAKEKLILTGTMTNPEAQLKKWIYLRSRRLRPTNEQPQLLPLDLREKARCYWDFVLPALIGHGCMDQILLDYDLPLDAEPALHEPDGVYFKADFIAPERMGEEEVARRSLMQAKEETLRLMDPTLVRDEETRNLLEERFSYVYPLKDLSIVPVKVSVSELKKREFRDDEEEETSLFPHPESDEPMVPAFVRRRESKSEEPVEKRYTGAARGTAYHRVMECLDYRRLTDADLFDQIRELEEGGKLSAQEAACVKVKDLRIFADTVLGKRMGEAALSGKLFREQPFVNTVPASELNPSFPEDRLVLVQGIVDAYFFEGNEIILVDYKTDRVRDAEDLIRLYQIQLDQYAEALEKLLDMKVREIYIYSFTLKKEIRLR